VLRIRVTALGGVDHFFASGVPCMLVPGIPTRKGRHPHGLGGVARVAQRIGVSPNSSARMACAISMRLARGAVS